MKKKLESELMSIAHRILKLKGKEDVIKMHTEAKELFEKLSVLKFAHENLEDNQPTIGNDSSFFSMLDTAFNNKVTDHIDIEDKTFVNLDDNQENEITEPLMETIKDMVAQMPEETHKIDDMLNAVLPKTNYIKNDLEALTPSFKDLPVFEPVSKTKKETLTEKKSLNDTVKKGGLAIGLNDKIAFITHLFDGQNTDYDRVLSQLNTFSSFQEAKNFIDNIIKPDYNNWANKEEFEDRLMAIIERKYN